MLVRSSGLGGGGGSSGTVSCLNAASKSACVMPLLRRAALPGVVATLAALRAGGYPAGPGDWEALACLGAEDGVGDLAGVVDERLGA